MNQEAKRPLESIIVLDLSRVLSGPYCTMMLADMGAEVWKVEPPSGDDSRALVPPTINGESAYFLSVNRNKRDICIDLTQEVGRQVLLRLASHADVVVENFRPDQKHKLGIGYEEVVKVKSDIIYCSISGFGQDGPYRDRPGLDNIFQGMAGLMSVTGRASGPPLKAGERIADVLAGVSAAFGIMTALFHRQRTGEGQYLELALVDCLIAAQAPLISYYFATGKQPPRAGNGSIFSAPTGTFDTADRPLNICVINEKHWKQVCAALERQNWLDDPRFKGNAKRVNHVEALDSLIAEVLKQKEAAHWVERFHAAGVPCGLVYSYAEVFADPQVRHNGLLQEIPHRVIGIQKVVGQPVRLGRSPGGVKSPAPGLGEHSEEILRAAGCTSAEILALLKSGAVRQLT
jgi:crotonobetainyl-CoA:carnitine CoA-transferase CaiB-like acyl-CoA transferase